MQHDYDPTSRGCGTDKGVHPAKLDPWPRVILLPQVGICAVGRTLKEADAVADVYEHTVQVMTDAADSALRTGEPLDLFDMEYWSLEQAKLRLGASAHARPLAEKLPWSPARPRHRRGHGARLLALARTWGSGSRWRSARGHPWRSRSAPTAPRRSSAACRRHAMERGQTPAFGVVAFFGGIDVLVSNAGPPPKAASTPPPATRPSGLARGQSARANHVAAAAPR